MIQTYAYAADSPLNAIDPGGADPGTVRAGGVCRRDGQDPEPEGEGGDQG